jgi:hypothetical protein
MLDLGQPTFDAILLAAQIEHSAPSRDLVGVVVKADQG